jgi:uncharacterized protein YjbI with pentapeptide repeats
VSEGNETLGIEIRFAELEAEVKRLKSENDLFRMEHKIAGGFVTLVLAGPDLVSAFRKWFHVVMRRKETPVEESADLAAAITRRLFNVGIVGLFFASILPAGLLLWQNTLIRSQNQYFQEQNQHLQAQNKVILEDSTRSIRAQFIAAIYDEECGLRETRESSEEGIDLELDRVIAEQGCAPKAHVRSRAEAALALVALDRGQGIRPSLADAKLKEADLQKAHLEEADLRKADLYKADLEGAYLQSTKLQRANLERSDLEGANLREADLFRAKLQRANLQRANLQEAKLRRANLEGANLQGANLWQADLEGANLQGTNLQGVVDLTKLQLAKAIISKDTNLPYYLKEHREYLVEQSK